MRHTSDLDLAVRPVVGLIDEYPAGLVVTLSNIPGVGNVNVTVAGDGSFSYTVELSANASGTVSASVTDWWGAVSQTVTCTVS